MASWDLILYCFASQNFSRRRPLIRLSAPDGNLRDPLAVFLPPLVLEEAVRGMCK